MSSSERRRLLAAVSAAGISALLAGCGFQLRQPPRLAFSSIALVGFAPRSPLAEELKRQLARQVQVQDDPARAEIVLRALEDVRERSIVASTSAALVREQQLRLKLSFRADTPGGRELIARAELLVARDLSYSETAALAKESEEAELFREMQSDVVGQVLRRLASVSV
ncbi:LPS-assembly lipoprotein LptE [Rubrivivax sp. A210]|uniref:LPS-assembly lipoprotein LptE n=1 Tax=Rubrivivax sp. A210 TaxID=2772301 RepID=UPI001918EB1B|nr:LPS assembly lipoprotein LptE [Rubrivivax sp. A210]CAD5373154.1 LPS-assembly lipoprotein LptE [Rubrivivax sp. A210]